MSETKFTPGPWISRSIGTPNLYDCEEFQINVGAEGYIATVDSSRDENKANAHLIAAAPEMYEALANIENDDGRIPQAIWDMRNKALAKARGES